MKRERAVELLQQIAGDGDYSHVVLAILAAAAEARREALTEAAKMLDDDSRYESSKIVLALREAGL